MINITSKEFCCGCGACEQSCPKHCIAMQEDNEGFLYPVTTLDSCVDCGVCNSVCPLQCVGKPRKPLSVWAAKNDDDKVRMQSSSGGIFSLLAERVIQEGGVVFGAKFDENWNVIHDYTETTEGLSDLRGSKYVQSNTKETFISVRDFLRQERMVLFSGTPCQIAGLKQFLKKDYEKLILVDVVCHGVPSPKVWRDYLQTVTRSKGVDGRNSELSLKEMPVITSISFRDKSEGWKKFGFVIRAIPAYKAGENTVLSSNYKTIEYELIHESLFENVYMQGFLKDIYLRPSCYSCKFRCGVSGSDITIADFWGIENIEPDFDDDKGCSLVLLNTERGVKEVESLPAITKKSDYKKALKCNSALERSCKMPHVRKFFWKNYDSVFVIDCIRKYCRKMEPSIIKRVIRKAKRVLNVKRY